MSRNAEVQRKTRETEILVRLNLEGQGTCRINTGIGFFDHMLTHLGTHGLMDLEVTASGDLQVDFHHTVEDVGICLGQVLAKALGEKKGIERFGQARVPMEDALADVAVDLSGRAFLAFKASFPSAKIGDFDVELVEEFLRAFSQNAAMNLHVAVSGGTNSHHIAEAIFKALGRALRQAVSLNPRISVAPSTKGTL